MSSEKEGKQGHLSAFGGKVAPNKNTECRKEIAGETPAVRVVQEWLASSTNLRSIAILLCTQVFL